MTTHHKPTAPRGWRRLRRGEIIRKGDKVWTVGRWLNTLRDPGSVIGLLPYIRRKKASRNGKLPLAGKTRKIPTPSGKEKVVGWVNLYRYGFRIESGICLHETKELAKKAAHDYVERICCLPITQSMLKRWRTK